MSIQPPPLNAPLIIPPPLWPGLAAVEQHFKISRWHTLQEYLRLHWSSLRLQLDDYLFMHLFNPQLSFKEKKQYIGIDAWEKIFDKYFPNEWMVLSEDKLFYYDIVSQHGYKTPKIFGLFHRYRHLNYAPTLKTPEALKDFLKSTLTYPCFTKPVIWQRSLDTFVLHGYDADQEILFDHQQNPFSFSEFYKTIEPHFFRSGYLFQELLTPDPQFMLITNNRLCTMRIIFMITHEKPECIGALLKIPMLNNHADNFWRMGNVIALLDKQTGKIIKALEKTLYIPLPILKHPITQKVFTEFQMPNWQELMAGITQLASIFPMLLWQAWDIALTDNGWVPLEANYGGDIHFAQWAYGKGLKSKLEKFLNIKIDNDIWK